MAIPGDEVYPILFDRKSEEIVRARSQGIRNPARRKSFVQKMESARTQLVTQEVGRAQKMGVARVLKERQVKIVEAQMAGNYEGANALISEAYKAHPELREAELLKNRGMAFTSNANNVLYNGSDADLDNMISTMKADRASVPLSESAYVTTLNRAITEKRRRDIEAERYAALGEKEHNKIAKHHYDQVDAAVRNGVDIPDAEWEKAHNAAQGTDYADKLKMLDRVGQFTKLDHATRTEALSSGKTFENAEEYGYMTAAHVEIEKRAKEDGMALAYSQGVVDYVPVDLMSRESVNYRKSQAAAASAHYGVEISPFTQEEVNDYTQRLQSMTSQEQAGMALAFQDMPQVWSQFTKSAPVFSQVGAIGDRDIAQKALAGQKKLDSGDVVAPSKNELLLKSNEYLGNVYGVEDKARVLDTARAIYAELAPVGNEGEFDTDAWEQALTMAAGEITQINGSRVVVPRDTDPDLLEDYVDTFDAERVRSFGGVPGYTDEQAAEMIQDAAWVSVAEGRYQINRGNDTLAGADGKPFTIVYDKATASQQAASIYSHNRQATQLKTWGNQQAHPDHFRR